MTKSLHYQALLYVYDPQGGDHASLTEKNKLYSTIYEDRDLTALVVRMETSRARWHRLGYLTRSIYGNEN